VRASAGQYPNQVKKTCKLDVNGDANGPRTATLDGTIMTGSSHRKLEGQVSALLSPDFAAIFQRDLVLTCGRDHGDLVA
jgi:hypothetical protein